MNKIVRLGLVSALLLSFAFAASSSRAAHDAATPSREILEKNIQDYLLNHPDIILELLDILRNRRQVSGAEQGALVARKEAVFNDPTSPIGGNPHGDVTIVEFFDYFCGYCKQVMPDLIKAVNDDGGIRLIFKELPILGPDSVVAARIALAAHRQVPEKYPSLHAAMIAGRTRMNEGNALRLAGSLGYDIESLRAAMNSPEIDQILARNSSLAKQLGIKGTPGFVIGDQIIPGAITMEMLLKFIAEARRG